MTIPKIMRGSNPSTYRQDWIKTTAVTELPTGTASVDFTVVDASLFPRGTGSSEPGECVIMSDDDAEAGREVLYDWTSVSGNTLMGCSRRYGSITSAGAVVKIAFTGGMYEAFKTEIEAKLPASYLDTDGTLAANSDSKIASQKATKTYADGKIPKVSSLTNNNLAKVVTGGTVSDAGVSVSIDGTFASNSDALLPSEKAAKTYADGKIPKVTTPTAGNIVKVNAGGTLDDGGFTTSTDNTLGGASPVDTVLSSQKATKEYVDGLWTSRYSYLTTAAEITAAFADVATNTNQLLIAPSSYVFDSANLVQTGFKDVHFIGNGSAGVVFDFRNGYKWTTNKTTGVDYYNNESLDATFDSAAAHPIATSAGATWKTVADAAGAIFVTRGTAYHCNEGTANTNTQIYVPTSEVTLLNGTGGAATFGYSALFVPTTDIAMSGRLTVTGEAAHTGPYMDFMCLKDCDFSNLDLSLDYTGNQGNVFKGTFAHNVTWPNFICEKYKLTKTGGSWIINLTCGHNCRLPRATINSCQLLTNENVADYYFVLIYMTNSYGCVVGNEVVFDNIYALNADGGKKINIQGIGFGTKSHQMYLQFRCNKSYCDGSATSHDASQLTNSIATGVKTWS